MAVINVLDKKVYNRISAGEVVERPSSVVKEVIENAIDAGATKIDIVIKNSGLEYISVKDNGKGLEKQELSKVFLPHATSKIQTAEDLDAVLTLGFRGEALASIGAVALCSFVSRPKDQELGAKITCNGGEIGEIVDVDFYGGSEFTCADLFYNTPVRKQFLKSDKTEENEIITVVSKVALSRPDVAFTLTCDGKTVIETYGGGLKECISCIYGSKTVDSCYQIEAIKNGIRVSGFVGKISFTKPTRAFQTLIVNGRYVVDGTVSSAVSNAYGSYLMKRQYPFYVLNLEIPTEAVDVNVHPRKAEVRFSNNQIVYGAVYSTVSKVLDGTSVALEIIKDDEKSFTTVEGDLPDANNSGIKNGNGIETSTNKNAEKTVSEAALNASDKNALNARETPNESVLESLKQTDYSPIKDADKKQYEGEVPFKDVEKKTMSSSQVIVERKLDAFGFNPAKVGDGYASDKKGYVTVADSGYLGGIFEREEGVDIFAENKKYIEKLQAEKSAEQSAFKQQKLDIKPTMRYIGQAFLTYLIFECGDELYLIDQHAAHERLLYDKLYESAQNGKLQTQPLLVPYVFTVSREDFDSIYTRFDYFRELGIDINILRDDSFTVTALPLTLTEINLKEFFDDLIYDDSFKRESVPLSLKEKLMQTACKHAIKGGDRLDQSEIDALIEKLNGNFALRCPHGRPIAVKISKAEIEKWFKRTV